MSSWPVNAGCGDVPVVLSTVPGSGLTVTPCAPLLGEGRAETQILRPVLCSNFPENRRLRFWSSFSAQGKLPAHLSYLAVRGTSQAWLRSYSPTLIPTLFKIPAKAARCLQSPPTQHPHPQTPTYLLFLAFPLSSAITP